MCDILFQNYAAAINGVADPSTDLVPTFLLFEYTECSGNFFPNEDGVSFQTNTFTQGQTTNVSHWQPVINTQIPQSFFIPFNFQNVVMSSFVGRTSTFLGPFYSSDVSTLNWQTNPTGLGLSSMADDPIVLVTFNYVFTWQNQGVLPMCMGHTGYIGPFSLNRYQPQSTRCDYFMTNQWCNTYIQNNECGCFADLPAIEAQSASLHVNLPVICFGSNCATKTTYKTNNMISQPCNLTICEQTILSSPNIINAGTDTVFCGGQFFNDTGVIPLPPPVSPLPAPSEPSSGTPFYVWIMLAVSAILFVLLIFLLFAEKPTKESSLLHQIRKISKSRNTNLSKQPGDSDQVNLNDSFL